MPPPRRAHSLVRWIILGAVLIAGGITLVLVLRLSRPGVVVTEMVEGPAVQAFYATGTLEPGDREYQVKAGASGFVLSANPEHRYIDKGDRVRPGQVLAIIFDEGLQRAKDKADAEYDEKLAMFNPAKPDDSPVLKDFTAQIGAYGESLEAAQRAYKRYAQGIESGSANQADFDRALDRLKEVWSKVESLKYQREQAVLRLTRELKEAESAKRTATFNAEKMKLISPIDGFVLDKPQQIGTKVNVNDVILTVANTSPENLVMRAQVDEEDVTKVWQTAGGKELISPLLRPLLRMDRLLEPLPDQQIVRMTLYAFGTQSFTGHVVRIYPKADPERRTFEVDVRLDNPSPRMQAGMTGELAFEMEHKDRARIVPSQALQDGRFWVVRDGRLVRTDAKPGLRDVLWIEVATGLQPGDKVLISPVGTFQDGQAVKIAQEMDPRAAAEMNRPKKKELFRGGF
jgi:RND family efflux transporter MFP subunit